MNIIKEERKREKSRELIEQDERNGQFPRTIYSSYSKAGELNFLFLS